MELTIHERHARLVKMVRRDYQKENTGSRLFPNTSGWGWQGSIENLQNGIVLKNPRPIKFGIPQPIKGDSNSAGGADLLGETRFGNPEIGERYFPILTGIEIKTGNAKLRPNQKLFRKWLLSVGGFWYLARECPHCWDKWIPIKKGGKIIDWEVPYCKYCGGKGYTLSEEEN